MQWQHPSWLLLSLAYCNVSGQHHGPSTGESDQKRREAEDLHEGCMVSNPNPGVAGALLCMEHVSTILETGNLSTHFKAIEKLEKVLEQTDVSETMSMSVSHLMAILHKPKGRFAGLEISASDTEAKPGVTVNNSKVSVRLPRELDPGLNHIIVFCVVTWPKAIRGSASDEFYQNRLVGLSVRGKNIYSLQERVNITVNLTDALNETQTPRCAFLNFSTMAISSSGCETVWRRGQSHVTCSCDHLTYFGVLMVSASLSATNEAVLTYISLIGCSLSLLALLLTLLLFITKRNIRQDVSMKVHINLALSLILLNIHFLLSRLATVQASRALCLYVALSLHYSLLATFSWMALESFHLYLLLVQVFNIYIRRYVLKLGLVGWSVPAAIVCLVVLVKPDAYGHVPLDTSNPNSTEICYMVDNAVKKATTLGVFTLVFVFNLMMLVVTVHRVLSLRHREEQMFTLLWPLCCGQFGRSERSRAKQNISTLLGVTTLLGIPWGLIFFSFGHLTTAGLYLFCILNSLQGFFIFLWFVMSWRKSRHSGASL
ncbi:adhesion G-protein coupled receptor G1-like [Dunckerocampus dactyliophorus]|uniref:adhesion G-protein coupled receptor G1-like n=1 Tax=Dunckerocampus dactyliophorus TaxID=161453 RepID=UPI00240604A9|nr:adhesion G-protein coupled receptor G1-like [Dunckerocampus dactyliophorus]